MSTEKKPGCGKTSGELLLYIYGEHTAEKDFASHLEACEHCREELEAIKGTLAAVRGNLEEPTLSQAAKNRILSASRLEHISAAQPSLIDRLKDRISEALGFSGGQLVWAKTAAVLAAMLIIFSVIWFMRTPSPGPGTAVELVDAQTLGDELAGLTEELDDLAYEFEGEGVFSGFVLARAENGNSEQPLDLKYVFGELDNINDSLEEMDSVFETF